LIARTNATRPAVDVRYLGELSDDAVPTLVARLPELSRSQQAYLAARLLKWPQGGDWRSWNLSRERAQRTLRTHHVELQRLAGSAPR
jgi:hypothetical protein